MDESSKMAQIKNRDSHVLSSKYMGASRLSQTYDKSEQKNDL